MDADFLLTRPDDLLVVGVRLQNFTVAGTSATARGPAAQLVLVLPPQHLLEETVSGPPVWTPPPGRS